MRKKKKANKIIEELKGFSKKKGLIEEQGYDTAPNVKTYWEYVKHDNKIIKKTHSSLFQVFEKNSKKIKENNMGGLKTETAKAFNTDLENLKKTFASEFKRKDNFCQDQIIKSKKIDDFMKDKSIPIKYLYNGGYLKP